MSTTQTRRRFLTTLSLAGAASLLRAPPSPAAEGPLETTAIRFAKIANMCFAPQLVAEELLRAEGFTDIHYVDLVPAFIGPALASGTVDLSMAYTSQFAAAIDAVGPITLLAGVMVGCVEVFGNEGTRSIADLKGKSVGVLSFGSSPHMLLTVMAAHVGLDPVKDIHWVTDPSVKQLFVDGKIDAFLSSPPESQDLRARAYRSCHRQHCGGPAVVAILLLLARGQSGIRAEKSGCNQARAPCDPQGDGRLCDRAGACGATPCRWRFHHPLRLCPANAEGERIRQMARV